MKKIYISLILIIFVACKKEKTEFITIQNFINKNHISAKILETKFMKDITPKDSINYYKKEFFKLIGDRYAYGLKNIDEAIDYGKKRIEFTEKNGGNAHDYKTDLILLESLKKELDKYRSMQNKILGKMYLVTVKVEGNPFPEKIKFSLTNDLKKVNNIIE